MKTKETLENRIISYKNDIMQLERIQKIYTNNINNLCGGFSDEMNNTIKEQINFCFDCIANLENCIKNLKN